MVHSSGRRGGGGWRARRHGGAGVVGCRWRGRCSRLASRRLAGLRVCLCLCLCVCLPLRCGSRCRRRRARRGHCCCCCCCCCCCASCPCACRCRRRTLRRSLLLLLLLLRLLRGVGRGSYHRAPPRRSGGVRGRRSCCPGLHLPVRRSTRHSCPPARRRLPCCRSLQVPARGVSDGEGGGGDGREWKR